MLFLDLDRFKLINDSVGHAVGDELLVEVGRRIADVLGPPAWSRDSAATNSRSSPTASANAAESEALAAAHPGGARQPLWIAGRELFPSASIGIALWQPRYRLGEELLRDADAAMYRAKAEGRDRSALFDEAMRAHAMRLLDLEARPAPRDPQRRVRTAFPADRAPRRRRHHRPRGAAALAP